MTTNPQPGQGGVCGTISLDALLIDEANAANAPDHSLPAGEALCRLWVLKEALAVSDLDYARFVHRHGHCCTR